MSKGLRALQVLIAVVVLTLCGWGLAITFRSGGTDGRGLAMIYTGMGIALVAVVVKFATLRQRRDRRH